MIEETMAATIRYLKATMEVEITSGIDNLEQVSLLTTEYEDMEELEMLLSSAQANIMLAIGTFHSVKYLANEASAD